MRLGLLGALGALSALAGGLAACAAPRGPAALPGPVVSHSRVHDARRAIPPELLPSLEALEVAVTSGDDEMGRAILRRLMARQPTGPALELAQAFGRILDGREAIRALRLRLEAREDPFFPGRYALELVLEQEGTDVISVRPGPARLVRRMIAVQPDGAERRGANERTVPDLELLLVRPGEATRVDLGTEHVPGAAGALAVRCRWELRFLSGELLVEGRSLPAMRLEAEPASRVLLASFLPSSPVEPAELARYVREQRVRRASALERAVRVPPSRYREALSALAAEAERMDLIALEELIPALRWLAGDTAPGGDPEAWRRWLAARARADQPSSALDMPVLER